MFAFLLASVCILLIYYSYIEFTAAVTRQGLSRRAVCIQRVRGLHVWVRQQSNDYVKWPGVLHLLVFETVTRQWLADASRTGTCPARKKKPKIICLH